MPPMTARKALELHTDRIAEIRKEMLEKIQYIANETDIMRRKAESGLMIGLAVNPAMRAIDIATFQGELRAAEDALQLLKAIQEDE